MYKWYTFCHSQEYFVHFVFQCDKRFFWNEFMVKELLSSEVGFFHYVQCIFMHMVITAQMIPVLCMCLQARRELIKSFRDA